MTERINAEITEPGEYRPAGEMQGTQSSFAAEDVSEAFEVDLDRVLNAFEGEFGLGAAGKVDSKQAQQLSEVILGDQPLDKREAALMKLGAFTPRSDHAWGAGEADPAEESDSQRDDQPGN